MELPSGEVLSTDVVTREGEKNRLIQLKTAKAVAEEGATKAAPRPERALSASEPSSPAVRAGPPLAAWLFTGLRSPAWAPAPPSR